MSIILFRTPQISEYTRIGLRVDFYERVYKNLKQQTELAWKVYGDAIDAQEPRAVINGLYNRAMGIDNARACAWRDWQNAKRDYLMLMN